MQKLVNSAWFLLILIATLPHPLDAIALPASQADVPPSSVLELKPVLDLAHRVVPWMDGKLVLIRIPRERGDDVIDLRTEGGKLVIRASDPSSAAMGLDCYLRYYCHRSMSQVSNNLVPVKVLPELARPVHRTTRFKYRYFLNYCTFNYSSLLRTGPRGSANSIEVDGGT